MSNELKELSVDAVTSIFESSIARDSEIDNSDVVTVEGIVFNSQFNKVNIEGYREDIKSMLMELPNAFRMSSGGGWSFLNLCTKENGVQWTGEHRIMDMLIQLGIGLGLCKYLMPRDMWSMFPGGMPYIAVLDNNEANSTSIDK